jgi:hypothetical protein
MSEPNKTGKDVEAGAPTEDANAASNSSKSTTEGKPIKAAFRHKESTATAETTESESEPLLQFLTGMKDDLKVRMPLYADDWARPQSIYTVVNATIFAFVIQLIPALIFAELIDRETEGNIATAETLLSSGIMGVIYAVFAGQPRTFAICSGHDGRRMTCSMTNRHLTLSCAFFSDDYGHYGARSAPVGYLVRPHGAV